MHILYDLTPVYATRGGNHTYSKELHAELSKNEALHLSEFAYKRRPGNMSGLSRKLNAAYRDFLYFPIGGRIQGKQADLIHSTGVPVLNGTPDHKHIITLHDLAILDTPERFSGWAKTYFERIYLPSLKRCRAILTNSHYTKGRLAHHFPELSNKATVTPLASKSFDGISSEPVTGLPDRFFLFVGSADPAKNLKLLSECYAEAESRNLTLPPTAVVGTANFGVGDDRQSDQNFSLLGGVNDSQLKWLYENCQAFLFPSYYEGFGLPILEAMTLGAPVICGRICSLPEVAGDAARYSELQAEAYTDAMHELDQDEGLRASLIEKGHSRAASFSWQATADITYQTYFKICEG